MCAYSCVIRLQGEDWEEGFANGLLNSLCIFPLLSYGATAPLAAFPVDYFQPALAAGWDERPAGRARLKGEDGDAEDNLLKELLIATTLLDLRGSSSHQPYEEGRSDGMHDDSQGSTLGKEGIEMSQLQVIIFPYLCPELLQFIF